MPIEITIYEQPVNEHARACLRLEHLFRQIAYHIDKPTIWDSRLTISAIIDVLAILDRPDLKTKLTKELCRHLANLSRLEQTPHVDRKKLSLILVELEDIIDSLQNTNRRIAQNLRDNDFLNSVRQHLLNPGGACHFDVPAYHFWLQRPSAERIEQLNKWVIHFTTVQAAVRTLLHLTRGSSPMQNKLALGGFFQTQLDPQSPCQLVQVAVLNKDNVYPEISVGRHGAAIRFYTPTLEDRATQTTKDIQFRLNCCV